MVLEPRHRGKQGLGKLPSDNGCDLGNLFCRSEPIKPRHQRILQRRWYGEVACRARFGDRSGQLFDKQRHAIGFRQDFFQQIGRHHRLGSEAGDQLGTLSLAETAEGNRRDMVASRPG